MLRILFGFADNYLVGWGWAGWVNCLLVGDGDLGYLIFEKIVSLQTNSLD